MHVRQDDDKNDVGHTYRMQKVHTDHTVISKELERTEYFVCGNSISDLHHLKQSNMFTSNKCATQELHRRIEAQKVRWILKHYFIKTFSTYNFDIFFSNGLRISVPFMIFLSCDFYLRTAGSILSKVRGTFLLSFLL